MNRNPSGSHMPLSKAITGFLQYKQAENMADRTITSYTFSLKRWLEYEGDKEVGKITSKNIIDFMNWLRTEYRPKRFSRRTHPLSNKTMRNEWITLSSFFHWAHDELKVNDIMADVPAPKFKFPPIETFTKEEMERMLKACLYAREAQTVSKRDIQFLIWGLISRLLTQLGHPVWKARPAHFATLRTALGLCLMFGHFHLQGR